MSNALVKLGVALAFFAFAVLWGEPWPRAIALFGGLVLWTVFVQDHMT